MTRKTDDIVEDEDDQDSNSSRTGHQLLNLEQIALSGPCAALEVSPGAAFDPYSDVSYDFNTQPIPLTAPPRTRG